MSNLAARSRRTVPLDAAEEGNDHSVPAIDEESSSKQSPSQLPTPLVPRRRHSDNSRRSCGSSSRRSRGGNPQNYLQGTGTEEFAVLKGGGGGGGLSQSSHSRDESVSIRSNYSKGSAAQSAVTTQSLPMDELKRFLRQPSDPSLLRTPSLNKSRTMTIGSSSNLSGSRSMLSASSLPLTPDEELSAILPDLFSLEQALAECEEDDLKAGLERLYAKQKQIVQEHQSQQSRGSGSGSQKTPYNQNNTPIAWKTPFEVDAPRETPGRTPSRIPSRTPTRTRALRLPGSPSSSRSSIRDMTDEQDAWAGIDELLETKSLDDSYCMSTTDILPQAVVRGMRRDLSRSSFGESVFGGESVAQESVASEAEASRSSKRSAESISKSSSSHSSNRNGLNLKKKETDADGGESADKLGPLKPEGRNNGGTPTTSGSLFDMFHWSEKDNVDALRERKTKLNSQKHKISFAPVVADDNCSLPSLATIQDDDSARVPNYDGKDWQTLVTERETFTVNFKPVVKKTTQDKPDKEQQQQEKISSTKPSTRIKKVKKPKSKSALKKTKVGPSDPASEKLESLSFEPMPQLLELAPFEPETQKQDDPFEAATQQEDDNAWIPTAIAHDIEQKPEESAFGEVANEEPKDEIAPSSSNHIKSGASIILDEKVDKYIQEIQEKLPSLARGDLSSKKKNGKNTMAEVESPSPTNGVDEGTSSPLSGHTRSAIPSPQPMSQSKPKVVEKKEPKPSSFSKLFWKTIKKKEKSPSITGRGDEKYFPQEVLETSNDTSDHCLLLQGDDGVNWD
jgi:hypothetical protein